MLLISPQVEAAKNAQVPRDMVLVLDTSGSMRDVKMDAGEEGAQVLPRPTRAETTASRVINFATTVNTFRDKLVDGEQGPHRSARTSGSTTSKPTGGTAIRPALDAALDMRAERREPAVHRRLLHRRPADRRRDRTRTRSSRTSPAKNTANTRIFTFGVGDDVNAAMLDQLAEATRAVSTYVRPAEDIEAKVASLYGKISHPVLTDLKLDDRRQRPPSRDLPAAAARPVPRQPARRHRPLHAATGTPPIKLTGKVGKETKEFVYELTFPAEDRRRARTSSSTCGRGARSATCSTRSASTARRRNWSTRWWRWRRGTASRRRTRATWWCRTRPMPVVQADSRPGRPEARRRQPAADGDRAGRGGGGFGGVGGPAPGIAALPGPGGKPPASRSSPRTQSVAGDKGDGKGGLGGNRGATTEKQVKEALDKLKDEKDPAIRAKLTEDVQKIRRVRRRRGTTANDAPQGRQGRLPDRPARRRSGQCVEQPPQPGPPEPDREPAGATAATAWRSAACGSTTRYKADTKSVTVKAQSDAYFRILEKHPEMKDVFRLGNHVVWITPERHGAGRSTRTTARRSWTTPRSRRCSRKK